MALRLSKRPPKETILYAHPPTDTRQSGQLRAKCSGGDAQLLPEEKMVRLDNLFSRKTSPKSASAPEPGLGQAEAGPTNLPPGEEQALDRKSLRLERRELLYAVVRESMARVGMLSSSYKYKVLSLDSRGNQYLIMMDLPKEMADHIEQLAEIEDVITQNARLRHHIDVTAVYWRINELGRNSVLRKPRAEVELAARAAQAPAAEVEFSLPPTPPRVPGDRNKRFEPIRADEVHAFKEALATGKKPKTESRPTVRSGSTDFAPTEFPPTEFEETRMDEEQVEKMPLSRTQYGDLI
jgi:hypothetical protein